MNYMRDELYIPPYAGSEMVKTFGKPVFPLPCVSGVDRPPFLRGALFLQKKTPRIVARIK